MLHCFGRFSAKHLRGSRLVVLRLAVDVDDDSELHILVPVEAAVVALGNSYIICFASLDGCSAVQCIFS